MSLIDPTLEEVLVCTVDKADLVAHEQSQLFQCTECGREYPVTKGVAWMMVEDSEVEDSEGDDETT